MLTLISRLKEAVFSRRPVLKEILMKHGEERLADYARRYHDVTPNLAFAARREECLAVVREEYAATLGDDVAETVVAQLRRLPVISTADHHGPLVHPLFLNSNALFAIPFLDDAATSALPVFAFSSVSLNNNSSYGRGFLFRVATEKGSDVVRVPLFPDREKMCTVFGLRALQPEDVTRAIQHLHERSNDGTVRHTLKEKLSGFIHSLFHHERVLAHKTFSAQVTHVNHHLWQRLFHGASMPSFASLDVEQMSIKVLLHHHLTKPDSPFYQLLFVPSVRRLVWEYFCGIEGALQHDRGTHFFWGIDPKHHRVSLWEKDGILQSRDGAITIALTPDAVFSALQSGIIFPSMFLIYLLLGFYYGFRCLGGFSQVNTLSYMKLAWRAFLTSLGRTEDLESIRALDVHAMNDGFTIAYAEIGDTIVPAAAFDLFLYGDAATLPAIQASARAITLIEGFLPALPEIYRVLYSQNERNSELLSVTSESIIEAIGLREKITPCARIPSRVSMEFTTSAVIPSRAAL